jgi:hypothetical protein
MENYAVWRRGTDAWNPSPSRVFLFSLSSSHLGQKPARNGFAAGQAQGDQESASVIAWIRCVVLTVVGP